jgi:hypothetical protein
MRGVKAKFNCKLADLEYTGSSQRQGEVPIGNSGKITSRSCDICGI